MKQFYHDFRGLTEDNSKSISRDKK